MTLFNQCYSFTEETEKKNVNVEDVDYETLLHFYHSDWGYRPLMMAKGLKHMPMGYPHSNSKDAEEKLSTSSLLSDKTHDTEPNADSAQRTEYSAWQN